MGIRIVTDSSSDLPSQLEKELKELGAKIVPFLFHFGLESCVDKTMSMKEFLSRAEKLWPQTSVPSPGAFLQAFRECVEAGHQVICLTITGRHSGSYASAALAGQQFPTGQVTVVDSESLSLGQGLLVLAAARAAQAGKSVDAVVETIKELQRRLHVFITLDTVKFLVKGGRASRLSGALAELLKIRPILTLIGGELTLLQKVRSRESAKQRLIELVKAHFPVEFIGVAHIACETEARELASEIARQTGFPLEKIPVVETGMVLATHGGPGTLGAIVVSQ